MGNCKSQDVNVGGGVMPPQAKSPEKVNKSHQFQKMEDDNHDNTDVISNNNINNNNINNNNINNNINNNKSKEEEEEVHNNNNTKSPSSNNSTLPMEDESSTTPTSTGKNSYISESTSTSTSSSKRNSNRRRLSKSAAAEIASGDDTDDEDNNNAHLNYMNLNMKNNNMNTTRKNYNIPNSHNSHSHSNSNSNTNTNTNNKKMAVLQDYENGIRHREKSLMGMLSNHQTKDADMDDDSYISFESASEMSSVADANSTIVGLEFADQTDATSLLLHPQQQKQNQQLQNQQLQNQNQQINNSEQSDTYSMSSTESPRNQIYSDVRSKLDKLDHLLSAPQPHQDTSSLLDEDDALLFQDLKDIANEDEDIHDQCLHQHNHDYDNEVKTILDNHNNNPNDEQFSMKEVHELRNIMNKIDHNLNNGTTTTATTATATATATRSLSS